MSTALPFPTVHDEEIHPPLSVADAQLEANRCLYCADAPCMQACPTHIDIPGFIKKISSGNLTGSAKTILKENFLGGTCARVCPVEELCQGACVLNKVDRPIAIGRLQRHATDYLMEKGEQPFPAGESTGKKVLVIGSGPAGLSAAAHLAQYGHTVDIWERNEMAGGLSTYGIITLREPIEVALKEVEMVRELGVNITTNKELESAEQLDALSKEYDAIFLGIGLGNVPALNIPGGDKIVDGLKFIADFKTNPDSLEAPNRAVVIGAGNTAIDAATTARQMGAQSTVVYRRTSEEMTAFDAEYAFATAFGIEFQFLANPAEVLTDGAGNVTGLRCTRMVLGESGEDGRRSVAPSDQDDIIIPCDLVLSAIGQEKHNTLGLDNEWGYISVDEAFRTSANNVFAGGDAVRNVGDASTVMAVQDGKLAAAKINEFLERK